MARIRSIKPEFWTSAQVLECSTNARLLFIGMWNFCDDAGRHPDSPKQLKAEIFPADDFTIENVRGMVEELEKNGLIMRYVVDGKALIQVTGWEHQRIDKPQKPKYPGPFKEDSGNNLVAFPPDRIGKDRIGKEGKEENTLSEADASTEPSVNEPKWTPEDKALADYMLTRVRDVSPSAKGSRNWPDHIRLMRERDKRSHDEIRAMFDWANTDAFWRVNILSPDTLRKQWVKLEAKRNSSPPRRTTMHSGFDAVDYSAGINADGSF